MWITELRAIYLLMFPQCKASKHFTNVSIFGICIVWLVCSVYSSCVWPTWKKASSADWNRGLPPACWCVLVHLIRKPSSKCLLRCAEQLWSKCIRVGIARFSARTETSVTSCATSLSRICAFLHLLIPQLSYSLWGEQNVFTFLRLIKSNQAFKKQQDRQKAPNEWR